jgi:iron complex outermembrane receptor protein
MGTKVPIFVLVKSETLCSFANIKNSNLKLMKQFVILLLITIGYQAFAQDTVKTIHDTSKTILELGPVVVIGVRADSKTPVSQRINTREEIQKTYQGQEIPILLDKSTSITSQSDGGHPQGYTYFRIRGIDQSRVNMTLNGVPLNEPEDQGVYTSNYPGFINAIASTQIERGVGSSTNGVASYAGSINFISQSGFQKENELTLSYGSFNTKRANLSIGTGLKNGYAFFASMSVYGSDGYKYRSSGSGGSAFLTGGHYGKKDIFKVTVFAGQAVNQMAWLAVADSIVAKDPRTNTNKDIGDANDMFSQALVQVQYVRTLTKYSKFSSTVFYNRLDGEYDYFLSGGTGVRLASNFYGLVNSYQYSHGRVKFNAGINANGYNRQHKNVEDHTADYGIGMYKNKGVKNDLSAFTKLGYDIGKFTAFGDVQYRYAEFKYHGDVPMDKLNWNFFMPKVGLTYNASNTLKYYASVGTSKREPTRTNLFGGADNLVQLTSIKPEQVVDYELGVNQNTKRLYVQSNVYYMDFKNEITLLGALGSNALPLMTNVTKSFRSGLEVDVIYRKIWKRFSTSTNLNWSYNRIKDGGKEFQPLYTPTFVWNQALIMDYGRVSMNINTKYQNKSYISFDNKYTTPEFVTFGANFSYMYKWYTISLQGNNLTGKNYFTNGYVTDNVRYLFANARQSYYATLKVNL